TANSSSRTCSVRPWRRHSGHRERRAAAVVPVTGVWIFLLLALIQLSPAAGQTSPSTYSTYTRTDAKVIPPPPALGPANSVITDPTFGSRILRVTDQNTEGGAF